MDSDTVQKLLETGRNSRPPILKCDQEPAGVYYLLGGDGEYVRREAAQVKEHTCHTLEALADVATHDAQHDEARVWYGRDMVTLVLDDGGVVAGRARLAVVKSVPFKRLEEMQRDKPRLTQDDLVRDLKTTFRDCLGAAGNLLAVVRHVKFNLAAGGASEVGHGKVSLSRSTMSEVSGSGAIPEYVTLQVPVFANPDFISIQPVECALDPDPATSTFRLTPLPGHLDRAIANAESHLADRLRKLLADAGPEVAAIPVRCGTP